MRVILLLSLIGLFISCQNKDEEFEDIIYPTTLQGAWDCSSLKSNLLTDREVLDREINNKLNGYTPDLTLDFTIGGCGFWLRGESFENQRRYRYDIKNGYVIFYVDDIEEIDDDKIRFKGQLKNNKLHMNFDYADFKNFVWVLGDNFPFNKDFLNPVVGGSVTLIVDKQIYD